MCFGGWKASLLKLLQTNVNLLLSTLKTLNIFCLHSTKSLGKGKQKRIQVLIKSWKIRLLGGASNPVDKEHVLVFPFMCDYSHTEVLLMSNWYEQLKSTSNTLAAQRPRELHCTCLKQRSHKILFFIVLAVKPHRPLVCRFQKASERVRGMFYSLLSLRHGLVYQLETTHNRITASVYCAAVWWQGY